MAEGKPVKLHLSAGADIYSPADPRTRLRWQTHGVHYFMGGISNQNERAVAINRAVGKVHGWDTTKWLSVKKGPDRGNKWRLMKNIVRFMKNPTSYTYWKFIGYFDSGRIRVHHVFLLFIIYYNYDVICQTKIYPNWYINKFYSRAGIKPVTTHTPVRDSARGTDSQSLIIMETEEEKVASNIHLNAQCRDQNYRKYFEMRAKNGITPPGYSD